VAAASRTLVVVAALVALTVASYLAWLGWDQKKTRVPGTFDLEGPYEPWQVIGLAVTLAVVAVVVTLRYTASLAIVVIPLALTVVWSVDAASGRLPDANLWPIGAASLAVGSLAGIALTCAIATSLRDRLRRQSA
jgi:hypothetical protein